MALVDKKFFLLIYRIIINVKKSKKSLLILMKQLKEETSMAVNIFGEMLVNKIFT